MALLTARAVAGEGVILLHGLSRTSQSMSRMATSLSHAGYTVVNVDYPSRTADIAALSRTVVAAALVDSRLQGCSRVHFVTHSLGGILVRCYFAQQRDDRLGRVVMLGPPNQGSEVVDRLKGWWLFRKLNGPAGQQLGTDSLSIPNLLGPVRFELGIIAGDRSINWINSMMIDGRSDGKVSVKNTTVVGMKEHRVLPVTHPFMMKDREAIALTLHFLKYGSFSSKERVAEGFAPL